VARTALTAYRLKDTHEAVVSGALNRAIRSRAPADQPAVLTLGVNAEFEASLFYYEPEPAEPPWVAFLEGGFPQLAARLQSSKSPSAVLVVRHAVAGTQHCYAFTFGQGRHMLASDGVERRFGIRTALNSLFVPGQTTLDAHRLRRVDARSISENTVLTNRQTNRDASFEEFGVDIRHDLMAGTSGTPVNQQKWGSKVTGRDALSFTTARPFDELHLVCEDLENEYARTDYLNGFSWVDNITRISDTQLVADLEAAVVAEVATNDPDAFCLAPPEVIEWAGASFLMSADSAYVYPDLEFRDYLVVLATRARPLSLAVLQGDSISVLDENEDIQKRWTVFECLDGEITHAGERYLLVGGEFYAIAQNYVDSLDAEIDAIPMCAYALPDWDGSPGADEEEADYNLRVSEADANVLLLDRKLIRLETRTSTVEFCDLMGTDLRLFHVKRHLASSTLSHCFAQAAVSGDLLKTSEVFLQKVRERIEEIERERALSTGDPSIVGRFSSLLPSPLTPSTIRIVMAIIADWGTRTAAEAMPFFSKVNLRRHCEFLARMGYQFELAMINH
jgi:uncharacterized protein (TIGR04141 family)